MNNPEATQLVLSILRKGDNFQWYVITFLAAAFFSLVEILLVKTPAFVWLYPWWGAFPVFITVYIPFFLAAFYCYDWKPKTQIAFIGALTVIDVLMMVVFAGALGWI